MPTETIHVGDIGTIFEAALVEWDVDAGADVPLDVSSATVLELLFENAVGVVKTVTATLTTDGTDGKVQYATLDADFLDYAGQWRWQNYLELPDWSGHSDVLRFEVQENLS